MRHVPQACVLWLLAGCADGGGDKAPAEEGESAATEPDTGSPPGPDTGSPADTVIEPSEETGTGDTSTTPDTAPDSSGDTAASIDTSTVEDSSADLDTAAPGDSSTDRDTAVPFEVELATAADAKLIGERAGDAYGIGGDHIAVSGSGDVNADGHDDLLVGLVGDEGADEDWGSGATYLVHGPVTGELDLSLADAKLLGSASEYSGQAVSGAGDMNGDGYADILVGAPLFGLPSDAEGQAYVVLGPVTGEVALSEADAALHGEPFEGEFCSYAFGYTGDSLSAAGDTDGDGNADVLVGAYGFGTVYLVLGPVAGTAELEDADAHFISEDGGVLGYGIASAGDTDGDGLDDILVGQPGNTSASVLLFNGPVSSDASVFTADTAFAGPGDHAGFVPRSAGDVDGDGTTDVLVDSLIDDTAGPRAGAVTLYLGPYSSDVPLSDANATLLGAEEYGYAGYGMAGAGDVDGDGFSDFVIGAPELAFKGEGTTWLFYGVVSGTLSLAHADVQIKGDGDDRAGYAVAGAGDVDADGLDDLLIGGPGDDDGGTGAGAAWLVLATSMR